MNSLNKISVQVYNLDFPVKKVIHWQRLSDVDVEFIADPFILQEGNSLYLFFEVKDKQSGLGMISYAQSTNAVDWEYKGVVLQESYHLSYPYIFKYQDSYYMIPESHQDNSVKLYIALEFPHKWTYKTTLITGRDYTDASIFRYNNKFWMFVSQSDNSVCYLFYAESLEQGWQEHKQSPIVINDAGCSRPAGRIFQSEQGKILRPAQDCRQYYGDGIRLFEVQEIDENNYKEKEIKLIPRQNSSHREFHFRQHHLDAVLWEGSWLIVSDKTTFSIPWHILFYGESLPDLPVLAIRQITSSFVDTDPLHPLGHLVEGIGVGFESLPPYKSLSNKGWCTLPIQGDSTHYRHFPIVLDICLFQTDNIEAIGIWLNDKHLTDSVKDFTIQFSDNGTVDGLSAPIHQLITEQSDEKPVIFPYKQIRANLIRIKIYSKNRKNSFTTDRTGLKEIAVFKHYPNH